MVRPTGASVMMGPGPGGPGGPGAKSDRPENLAKTLLRMWRYFSLEKAMTILMLVVVACGVVFGVFAPMKQSEVVDAIAQGVGGAEFNTALALMLGAYLLYALCSLGQGWIGAHLSTRIVRRMREQLFGKVLDLPVPYLDQHSHGDIMSRMTNDIENISMTISESLPSLFSGVLTIVGVLGMMVWMCWQMALLTLLTTLLTLVITRFVSVRVRRFSRQRQALLGRVNGTVEESISSFASVSAYNYQDHIIKGFDRTSDALTDAGIKAESYAGIMGPMGNCVRNISFLVVAAFGGLFASQGIISIGIISAFIVYAQQIGRPISDIADIYSRMQSAVASAERVFLVLDEADEDARGSDLPSTRRGEVSFEKVCFSYDGKTPVINDFTLQVPAGKKVALVGATGSGKTTVVSLLERFYDLDSGRILVDGVDIASVSRNALRQDIAIVLQETTLFDGTVAANLRFGNPDATDEELYEALRMSCCIDVVNTLPQGLETRIGAAGESLSQGQRQLLAIARAFVADPRVLVLDEATSNVDTRTEKAVQEAMQHIMRNRTSICIAHRLSTIVDADLIVVMDAGCIVETGTHTELLQQKGRYYDLYMTQFAGYAT